MIDKRRPFRHCPKCNSQLLVRENNKIVCVAHNCKYSVEIKRKDDQEIPELNFIRTEFNG
jgi:DNA-directed RNA polymerase subunit M/transcription elongation factor TFIIS